MTTHVNKPNHISLVSGAYYYLSLAILTVSMFVASFWQLQQDTTDVKFTEIDIVSKPNDRFFYVPISFCNDKIDEFKVQRIYYDQAAKVSYSIPTDSFSTNMQDPETGCFSTLLSGYTGTLVPGNYEYRVFIMYSINPIQTIKREIALVHIEVK